MFPTSDMPISFEEYYKMSREVFPKMYEWEIHLSYNVYLASFGKIEDLNKKYSELEKNITYYCLGRLN